MPRPAKLSTDSSGGLPSISGATLNTGLAGHSRDEMKWASLAESLDADGFAVVSALFSKKECQEAIALYGSEQNFRKRVVMQSHGYGRGEYKYFSYPLPPLVQTLRSYIYPKLAPIANMWNEHMNAKERFPEDEHEQFLKICHEAGQVKPTPLLLKYGKDDFNCLHQDLYGEHVFPLQLAVLLSAPGEDFTGGEFVMTEQRPRMQSRPMVVPLQQGDAVVFAVNNRPVQGTRGYYKVNLRHGVSKLLSGNRHTLGIIFHDAK